MDKARDLIEARLNSGAIERAAEVEIEKLNAQLATSNDSSGSVPASSGSTPERSPSVS
jgi:hypothetical protein